MAQNEELEKQLLQNFKEFCELRGKMVELSKSIGAMEVHDYELKDRDGTPVMLSSLFGDKNDLILVHNMGKSCPYCTLWADGFIGFTKHLNNRAAFVLVSPDEPSVHKEFAESRGWNFRSLSAHGSDFINDMGFEPEKGNYMPGVSVFRKNDDGKIRRVAKDYFCPGDTFCSVWHFFDLLEDGPASWQPKFSY